MGCCMFCFVFALFSFLLLLLLLMGGFFLKKIYHYHYYLPRTPWVEGEGRRERESKDEKANLWGTGCGGGLGVYGLGKCDEYMGGGEGI